MVTHLQHINKIKTYQKKKKKKGTSYLHLFMTLVKLAGQPERLTTSIIVSIINYYYLRSYALLSDY